MRDKHGVAALVLGMLLCFILSAATYAQEKLERYVASQPGVEVELLRLLPPLGGTGSGPAALVEQSNRTEVVVTLTGAPPDLVSPRLIAEIHEGTCTTLKSAPVTANETSGGYPLTPSVFSLHSFGAILPVSLAALRSGAHTITVRIGRETGNAAFACFDIA